MKKFLSIILALTFCFAAFSATAPTASAKSETISENEVKELVVKARDLMMVRYGYYDQKYFDHESDERRTVHLPEYNIDVTYRPVLESALPGGSYAAVCELANETYEAGIASKAYNVVEYPIKDGSDWRLIEFPNFYVDENGKVFACFFLEYCYIGLDPEVPDFISGIRGDSSEASAIITIDSYWGDGPRPDYYFPVECKFVNTPDGWRIAESEFSILFANDQNYLYDYREENPEKVRDDALKLAAAEAKYTVDEIMYAISGMNSYKQDYYEYAQKNGKEFVSILKEIVSDSGEKKTMQYVKASDNMFSSYGGYEEYLEFCVTESTYKLFDRAYADRDFERRITEGRVDYVAVPDSVNFSYDPETAVVKVVESTDKEATAHVYCELIKDGKRIPIYVECKLEKPYAYGRWYVAESPFIDMITSADRFEYTVGEAPATGDNAFDTIAVCLGGMALVMSVLALIPRKKRETL